MYSSQNTYHATLCDPMFYTYETDAGRFVIRRQRFTNARWELLINDRFVDSFASARGAAIAVANTQAAGAIEPLRRPPARLEGWEVRWNERSDRAAPELWLHYVLLKGHPGRRSP